MEQESISDMFANNEHYTAEYTGVREVSKYPKRHLALVTCMDTRLTEMATAALGLADGDANIIKVAGAEITEPYGTVIRSLLIAVHTLGVTDIMIMAHTNCGAQHLQASELIEQMRQAGIAEEVLANIADTGFALDSWLTGFGDLEASVHKSVELVRTHPLMPADIRVYGSIIDIQTGKLTQI